MTNVVAKLALLKARGSAVRDARVRWLALRPLRTGVEFLAPRALPAETTRNVAADPWSANNCSCKACFAKTEVRDQKSEVGNVAGELLFAKNVVAERSSAIKNDRENA